MNTAIRQVLLIAIVVTMSIFAKAQSPAPLIVQAASSTATAPTTPNPAAQNSDSLQAAIKLLQQMKATNEETLKKQEAALEQLDEIQKAADQLKIFSKRG
jgi:hypothetical protein